MKTKHEIRSITHNNQQLDLFYSWPQENGKKRPVVLIFSPWSGRDHFAEHKAHWLSCMGYISIAVDLYGDSKTGETRDECSALMMPFINDRTLLQGRIQTIINHVKHDPLVDGSKVAAIGYCFGGLCVLDAVRNNLGLCAGISVHGLYGKPNYQLPTTYSAKVLTLHGQKDPMVSHNDVLALQNELQNAGTDWQMIVYGLGYHAFTNPEANDPDFGTVFNTYLDDRTTKYVTTFLTEVL
jgi:dienelactone hydrolase